MSVSGREWIEADGLGGFASHTTQGTRTRRYHALLLHARRPPVDRRVLVNGVDVTVETDGEETLALTSQTYEPSGPAGDPVVHYEGRPVSASFDNAPWPTWTYELGDGRAIRHSIFVPRGLACVVLSWRLVSPPTGKTTRLVVRPFLSGRDYHALHRENPEFAWPPREEGDGRVVFQPYETEPRVIASFNGSFECQGHWYRNFHYSADKERGLDHSEDLASPGRFVFDLLAGEALLVLEAEDGVSKLAGDNLLDAVRRLRTTEEARRRAAASARRRTAVTYLAKRGEGETVLAGYPWFTDWGRDTFIALRGLCIATGLLRDARRVLAQWAKCVSNGMLPNRFEDAGEGAEFNSVDASLWFIVAVHELRMAERRNGFVASVIDEWALDAAILGILRGYASGTRHGIGMDSDGLLRAGEVGVQLTWMDAKVGETVVTPRIGKPVEVQALWINALLIGSVLDAAFAPMARKAEASFAARFWNEETRYLFDVVDADHVPGRLEGQIRPNALYAVGGLPFRLLDGERARAVVETAEARLLTPAGPRSLAFDDPRYRGTYRGGVLERDTAYHQGTVWPYLMGAFIEAWVAIHGDSVEARNEARRKYFDPFCRTLDPDDSGHFPEIADGDAPHQARGCPFQAWSLGETLRIDLVVLDPKR